jgi:hypothetical protein
VFISIAFAWCAVVWCLYLSVKFWNVMLCIYICVYLHSFSVVCCWYMFIFISTVLACHAVGLYLHILTVSAWRAVGLRFILQFQCDVLLVYIYIYVYSFSVACCWFSRISQSVKRSSIIGHADPCVVSSTG